METDLDKMENPREQYMDAVQKNKCVIRIWQEDVPDCGSRYPFSDENYKLFYTEVGRLGISVRFRSVISLDVKDPNIGILAKIGAEDQSYLQGIQYFEQQIDCSHQSCWDDLSVCTLHSGKLILRNWVEILIPPAARA